MENAYQKQNQKAAPGGLGKFDQGFLTKDVPVLRLRAIRIILKFLS